MEGWIVGLVIGLIFLFIILSMTDWASPTSAKCLVIQWAKG